VSYVNSSNTALAAGATFTGVWEECIGASSVILSCLTDQVGTAYMQFSPDAVNTDSSLSFAVAASSNEIHRLSITRRYYRVVMTNTSASAQTYMRLTTLYGSETGLNSPLNQALAQDADSMTGRMISEETSISEGKFTGYSKVNKFGCNTDVDGAEDIWDGGGDYTGFATSAEKVTVFSSDANDTANGTGGRTLRIVGLDANYTALTEDVTLLGLTQVDTVNSFLRVTRAYLLTAGTGKTNAGAITVRQKLTTTNIFSIIQIGFGQNQVSAYTIPAGYTGYLKQYHTDLLDTQTNAARMVIKVIEYGGAQRFTHQYSVTNNNSGTYQFYGGLTLPEKTDFVFRCTQIQNASAVISTAWDIVIVKN
jgi:hypothetical protein